MTPSIVIMNVFLIDKEIVFEIPTTTLATILRIPPFQGSWWLAT